ncbi:hypothetical protein Tco_0223087 [Tanacetum coccineum]
MSSCRGQSTCSNLQSYAHVMGIGDNCQELKSSTYNKKPVVTATLSQSYQSHATPTAIANKSQSKLNSHYIKEKVEMVVRLGINPMIQPEPEDLPKDNPKLEIAVLRMKKKCMDKGCKQRSPPHNLRQKLGQYICCQNHKLIADIENDIMDPVMQCTTLPSHSVDLIGDEDPTDEDRDIGMGDSIGVSLSLGGGISLGGKKYWVPNIGDSGNTRDGGKTGGRSIGACGGIGGSLAAALYACIYGSS